MTNKPPKILSSVDLAGAPEAVDYLTDAGELICTRPKRDEILPLLNDVDAYFASAAVQVDREFLNAAPKLKFVGSPSTGTDHLDLEELKKRGITVVDIAKEYELLNQFTATSELAFSLILSLVRQIIPASFSARDGIWARERFSGYQLYGKTMGIMGLGRLGKITARIANGFGMNVITYDPAQPFAENVQHVTFEELLSTSDILSIHIHLNADTEGIIGKKALGLMKSTAILINTSRGKIVDETALLEALALGQIAGAGLDVIDGEWLEQEELIRHQLIEYSRLNDNLLIVPHIGGATQESINLARIFMAKKIASYLTDLQHKLQKGCCS